MPCVLCRRFTAPDAGTLTLSDGCCLGDQHERQFRRNWDDDDLPGPPNSFNNAAGETFEFGAFNGLCAGSSSGVSYLRIC